MQMGMRGEETQRHPMRPRARFSASLSSPSDVDPPGPFRPACICGGSKVQRPCVRPRSFIRSDGGKLGCGAKMRFRVPFFRPKRHTT